jgi:hydrogenase expression/formation protein HypE
VPVRPPVRSVCEMPGYDPLFLACEGRAVAVAAPGDARALLARWRTLPSGEGAALIGTVQAGSGHLVLETELGGRRLLQELEDDPLPRIC